MNAHIKFSQWNQDTLREAMIAKDGCNPTRFPTPPKIAGSKVRSRAIAALRKLKTATIQDLMDETGLAKGSVQDQLRNLRNDGLVRNIGKQPRKSGEKGQGWATYELTESGK
ncbi:MAG: winged helix-turn-helix domain-containing protein [Pikeienuella sp.]